MTTVAFVLTSWQPDAPAGMERAVAAHATGLTDLGHKAVIITARRQAPAYGGVPVEVMCGLDEIFPCDDPTLRRALDDRASLLSTELAAIFDNRAVDVAVYLDALWGLGRVMPDHSRTRNVLAVHVVGHDIDLVAALARRVDTIVAPSPIVLDRAGVLGHDTSTWKITPNSLLADPAPQDAHRREHLRTSAPVRILARLGPEKGVAQLLATGSRLGRPVQIALAEAAFEDTTGSQDRLLERCRELADRNPETTIEPARLWDDVAPWLGGAAVVIVPSLAETFGLVALEAMSHGTPVIAHDVGNLPRLIGDGGVLVPAGYGPDGLWRAARRLLGDPIRYRRLSRAAYHLAQDYRPAHVADQLVKVVS